MIKIDRTDKSIIGRWWWTVDRWVLLAFFILIAFGIVLVTAASPSVATRIGLSDFHFVYRHLIFLIPSIGLLLIISLFNKKMLWRFASLMFLGSTFLMLVVLLFGAEIKGASRWIHLFGFSLQPSEFAKPAFAVVSAWVLARQQNEEHFPGLRISAALYGVTVGLLLMQPDFGMTFVISAIWGVQVFLSGLPMLLITALGGLAVIGIFVIYLTMPHVASRIDRFLDPASGDNYQVQKSLDAFAEGGLFGTGPGHGSVKLHLPDAHADFIFAVAGEELGLFATLILIGIFAFIIIRSTQKIVNSNDMFVILATGGLLTQFALQTLIHMGSSLQLLPAKGMTLPFISYGGSSLLSLGIACGMLLSLTRKRSA